MARFIDTEKCFSAIEPQRFRLVCLREQMSTRNSRSIAYTPPSPVSQVLPKSKPSDDYTLYSFWLRRTSRVLSPNRAHMSATFSDPVTTYHLLSRHVRKRKQQRFGDNIEPTHCSRIIYSCTLLSLYRPLLFYRTRKRAIAHDEPPSCFSMQHLYSDGATINRPGNVFA